MNDGALTMQGMKDPSAGQGDTVGYMGEMSIFHKGLLVIGPSVGGRGLPAFWQCS